MENDIHTNIRAIELLSDIAGLLSGASVANRISLPLVMKAGVEPTWAWIAASQANGQTGFVLS